MTIKISQIDDKNILVDINGEESVKPACYNAASDKSGRVEIVAREPWLGNITTQTTMPSDIWVNGIQCATAQEAVTKLNAFIGNFRKGGSTPQTTDESYELRYIEKVFRESTFADKRLILSFVPISDSIALNVVQLVANVTTTRHLVTFHTSDGQTFGGDNNGEYTWIRDKSKDVVNPATGERFVWVLCEYGTGIVAVGLRPYAATTYTQSPVRYVHYGNNAQIFAFIPGSSSASTTCQTYIGMSMDSTAVFNHSAPNWRYCYAMKRLVVPPVATAITAGSIQNNVTHLRIEAQLELQNIGAYSNYNLIFFDIAEGVRLPSMNFALSRSLDTDTLINTFYKLGTVDAPRILGFLPDVINNIYASPRGADAVAHINSMGYSLATL